MKIRCRECDSVVRDERAVCPRCGGPPVLPSSKLELARALITIGGSAFRTVKLLEKTNAEINEDAEESEKIQNDIDFIDDVENVLMSITNVFNDVQKQKQLEEDGE